MSQQQQQTAYIEQLLEESLQRSQDYRREMDEEDALDYLINMTETRRDEMMRNDVIDSRMRVIEIQRLDAVDETLHSSKRGNNNEGSQSQRLAVTDLGVAVKRCDELREDLNG